MTASNSQIPSQRWGIVGGGMMGLTLALRLARQGQKVTVLEAAPDLGGLASTWQIADFTWDKYYHVTLLSDERLRDLLAELDLEDQVRWVETKTGFLTDGKLYSMSNSWEFLRFPPLSLWEKFRLGFTIFYASKIQHPERLERLPVADWLRSWSGQGAFQKIWLPLLKAKLGNAYQRVSASFIWTTISRMYRARRSGLKKEMFGYVEGGYATVLNRLRAKLEELGVEICHSYPVEQIVQNDGGHELHSAQGEVRDFEQVVLTLPSAHVPRLCPGLHESELQKHRQIEYLGILCASMVLKRGLDKYYVTNITEPNVPFTAVIEMTALVDPSELDNKHLIYLPRYATSDDAAWQWTDEELEENFLSSLERLYSDFRREDVLAFRVSRVKQVMALPTLNYTENVPETKTSIENLYVVNSAQITQGTLNVNEVIAVADTAFESTLLPALHNLKPITDLPVSFKGNPDDQEACELVARS